MEQQLEDRRLEYEGVSAELQRLRRDRADFHRAAEVGLQRQQNEVAQREGVIARLTDQVDKMRGDSINQRVKLDELRNQRTALRKEVQELRAIMEDRDLRLEELRVMLDNRNEEVAAMEERVTHTREARGSLQLRHNETLKVQELVEATAMTTRAQEAEALKDRQIAELREEQLQKDREIEAIRRQLNSSETTAREAPRGSRCRWRFSDNSCCHPRPPRPILRAVICIIISFSTADSSQWHEYARTTGSYYLPSWFAH